MNFKNEISKLIKNASKITVSEDIIEIPPDSKMGDYAFPCFILAKELKKSPIEIAKDISKKIQPNNYISEIKQIGPYINFFVKKDILSKEVLEKIYNEKEKYGNNLAKPQTILLEGWQPNTHKAFHIGHIRNAVLGEVLARIFEFNGNKVIKSSYMGDIGAHVAKWIWYFTKYYEGKIPKTNVSKWSGQIYTKATLKSKENEKYLNEIHEIHKKLEDGDKNLVKLWKETRKLCLDDIWNIVKELDSHIDRAYFESEVEQPGIKKVKELEKLGMAKLSEGAIIMDLEKHKLGVFVLLKSNGASLYSTKDIALAYLKSKEYKFDLSLYVVASEQDHHFRQLFKTLELINYKDSKKVKHVSYGVVKLKDGKMSSRLGNIILYEDFRDRLLEKVEKQIKARNLPEKQKDSIVKDIAFGAMKFTMLNQDSVKEIVFDYDKALSFEGETGPYIQYSRARACSVLKKVNEKISANFKFSKLETNEEKEILKLLKNYPNIVLKSGEEYKPHIITRYLLDLSQAFNLYYHKYKIIQEDLDLQKARLLLVFAVKEILKSGLNLLSINAPEIM